MEDLWLSLTLDTLRTAFETLSDYSVDTPRDRDQVAARR